LIGVGGMAEFKFPDVGEGIHEGTIVKWRVRMGDVIKIDQVLVEVETDKAVVELPSPFAGKVSKINFNEGEVIRVGQAIITIDDLSGAAAPPQTIAVKPNMPQTIPKPISLETNGIVQSKALATPFVRKLARERGIDISKIIGTGQGGRITESDLDGPNKAPSQVSVCIQQSSGYAPKVDIEQGDQVVQLSHMRKVISERMSYSKTHIPHACGMDYVDVTKLAEIREKEKKVIEARGIKLTYLPFIVKACAIALHEFPEFNAHFDDVKNLLVLKKQINIGIAVETPEGLMVPVVKDIDKKSIVEIAQEIEHLAVAARERKIKLEDIKGGTFTITNVGSLGGMYSTPVIDPPEIAIMGVHRIRDMPLAVKDKVKIRKVMGISLCFDHRVVDGAKATQFMSEVMKHLEDPDLMLVDMI